MVDKKPKSKLSKDELKDVSGGAVYRAKVSSVQKVRKKAQAGEHEKRRSPGRER